MGNEIKNKIHVIDKIVREFLDKQLGEHPSSISSFLNEEIISVYAGEVVSPAESKMMETKTDSKFLIEFKNQQFASVKEELKQQLETEINQKITQIHSSVTEDGLRIINICL